MEDDEWSLSPSLNQGVGNIVLTSESGHKRSFVGTLEVQNQAIGWLQSGCRSFGGSTVIRFPRIWGLSADRKGKKQVLGVGEANE